LNRFLLLTPLALRALRPRGEKNSGFKIVLLMSLY
jgi:hypothetical protein